MKRSPIRKYNKERMYRKRHDENGVKHTYGKYHEWIGTLTCTFLFRSDHRCYGAVSGHHLLPVGRGGRDYGNEIPACQGIHTELHSSTELDIETRYGLSKKGLQLEAQRLAKEWDKEERGR